MAILATRQQKKGKKLKGEKWIMPRRRDHKSLKIMMRDITRIKSAGVRGRGSGSGGVWYGSMFKVRMDQ